MRWRDLVMLGVCGCGRVGFDDGGTPCRAVASTCADGFTCVDELCVLAPDALPADAPGDPGDAGDPADAGAPVNPAGTFTLGAAVAYTCAIGLVDLSVTSFTFAGAGATLTATSNDPGAPPQPCAMTGTYTAGSFDVTCTLAGGCNEVYRLAGAFTGPDTWSATLSATFTGQCLNCTAQAFAITGAR